MALETEGPVQVGCGLVHLETAMGESVSGEGVVVEKGPWLAEGVVVVVVVEVVVIVVVEVVVIVHLRCQQGDLIHPDHFPMLQGHICNALQAY